jgi:hypothetical protein
LIKRDDTVKQLLNKSSADAESTTSPQTTSEENSTSKSLNTHLLKTAAELSKSLAKLFSEKPETKNNATQGKESIQRGVAIL